MLFPFVYGFQPTECEKIFANYANDKELIYKIYLKSSCGSLKKKKKKKHNTTHKKTNQKIGRRPKKKKKKTFP